MRWERTSERLVRTLLRYPYFNQFIWSNLPIGPREEGKRWAVGNLKGGCVCHLDTYIPVSFFGLLVPIGQTEGWKWDERGKESLKGDTHFTQIFISQSTPVIYSSDQYHGSGKKREECERIPKGEGGCMPLRYVLQSIPVIIGSDQPNRREKERWAVEEKLWRGGTHVT